MNLHTGDFKMSEISVMIEAGKATAAAPLGPALGPLGVNIGDVVAKINEKTKAFAGVKVPVKINVDPSTKSFEISVGSPPTAALIKKELNIKKAASNPKTEAVANMSFEQLKKLAELKLDLGGTTVPGMRNRNSGGNVQGVIWDF